MNSPAPVNGAAKPGHHLFRTCQCDRTFHSSRTLEAPAGKDVALTMENKDSIEHTFSLYPSADSKDPLFAGQRFAGPSFLTYGFTAPETPGTYHFQCDIHPNAMKGDFVVK